MDAPGPAQRPPSSQGHHSAHLWSLGATATPRLHPCLGPYGSGQWVWGQPPAQHLSREVTAAEKPSCSLGDTTRVLPACIPHPWLHNELSLPHITPLDKQFAHQCVSNVFLHVPYNDLAVLQSLQPTPAATPHKRQMAGAKHQSATTQPSTAVFVPKTPKEGVFRGTHPSRAQS